VKKDTCYLIVFIFTRTGPESRILFHKKAIDSLKPGGNLVVEVFHPKQLEDNYLSGGPKNKDLLFTLTQLIPN
jgi:hypothetical protein